MIESEKIQASKNLIHRLWAAFRVFFIMSITWDFFLTVVIQTSVKAKVLIGVDPFISTILIAAWAISLLGICFILFLTIGKNGNEFPKRSIFAYFFLSVMALVYLTLAMLAIFNGIAFPVFMGSIVNMAWAISLIYFRNKVTEFDRN